jgi:hypothetical protein
MPRLSSTENASTLMKVVATIKVVAPVVRQT